MGTSAVIQYRIDTALLIADKIEKASGIYASVNDIFDVLTRLAVHDDYSLYEKIEEVYNALGYEYDIIEGL